MPIFTIIFYLLVILLMLFLGITVYFKKKSKQANAFAVGLFSSTLWILTVFLFFYSDNPSFVLWTGRASFAVALFTLLLLFRFIILFPKEIKKISNSFFLKILELTTIIFTLITLFTPLVIKDEVITGVMQRETVYGFLYPLWVFYFAILSLFSILIPISQYKKLEGGVEKKQILYVFLGICFAVIFSFVSFIALTGIGINDAEVYGAPIALLVLFSLTSHAILRHRLMDIAVATGKIATYFFTFLSVCFIAFFLIVVNNYLEIAENYLVILVAIISAMLFQPLFLFFEKLASRYLYYSFYSSQKVLNDLGKNLVKILDIDELSDLTTKTIMETMKLDRAVILLRDEKTKKFDVKRNFGFKEENGISLVKDSFLTEHLKKTQKPLVYEEFNAMMSDAKSEEEKKKIENLRKNMQKIEAALCNLLISKDEVIGMIVLGEKISKDPYTQQDVELLDNLCKQISISFQNAKLYSEVQDFSENLEKKVDEQVKELRVAYKKLQRLDKIKTEFMSIVSHQLRTPLSIIKGHLSMIEEGVYDNNKEKKKEILTNVYKANERLITLVNDVLNISRIQSGKVEIHKEETSIEKIIEETIEKMQKPAEDKGVKITFSKPKEDIPLLNIDTNKIENILINLIDNALKYTPQGEITISLQKEEKDIKIEIKDTGDGMTKEEIEKLFETFSRGEAGKKHWIQGSGLGLYIAKQFVEMHEGKIWATSEGEGKGSQFYITLPF